MANDIAKMECWNVYRNYVQHEDDLVHQRLNWMLLLQGFLFAAYASAYSGLLSTGQVVSHDGADAFHKLYPNLLTTLQDITATVPVLGFWVSRFTLSGVRAAYNAIGELEKQWAKKDFCKQFPSLTGGGHREAAFLGGALPFGIPLSICISWAYLGLRQAINNSWLHGWISVGFCIFVVYALLLESLNETVFHSVSWWKRFHAFRKARQPHVGTAP